MTPLPRTLTKGTVGPDVDGVGRALVRAGLMLRGTVAPIRVYSAMPEKWRRTYGTRKMDAVNRLRKAEGWPTSGTYGPKVHQVLIDSGAFDAKAIALLKAYKPTPVLTPPQRVRGAIQDFCERAEVYERRWHYTQRRPYTGKGVPPDETHYNDCSSYVCVAYFWAGKVTGLDVPDPAKFRWSGYGNTDWYMDDHLRVGPPYQVGDLACYRGHVTICRKAGNSATSVWSSFGSESGPIPTSLFYRRDLRFVVRPPLLA